MVTGGGPQRDGIEANRDRWKHVLLLRSFNHKQKIDRVFFPCSVFFFVWFFFSLSFSDETLLPPLRTQLIMSSTVIKLTPWNTGGYESVPASDSVVSVHSSNGGSTGKRIKRLLRETDEAVVNTAHKVNKILNLSELSSFRESLHYTRIYLLTIAAFLVTAGASRSFMNDLVQAAFNATATTFFLITVIFTVCVIIVHYRQWMRKATIKVQCVFLFLSVFDMTWLVGAIQAFISNRYLWTIMVVLAVALVFIIFVTLVPWGHCRSVGTLGVFIFVCVILILCFVVLPYREYWTQMSSFSDIHSIKSDALRERVVLASAVLILGIIIIWNLIELKDFLDTNNYIFAATHIYLTVMAALIWFSLPGFSLATVDSIQQSLVPSSTNTTLS